MTGVPRSSKLGGGCEKGYYHTRTYKTFFLNLGGSKINLVKTGDSCIFVLNFFMKKKIEITEEIDSPNREVLLKNYEEAKIKPVETENIEVGSLGELTYEKLRDILYKLFFNENYPKEDQKNIQ